MSRGKPIKEIEEFPRRIKIFFWIILGLFLFGTIGFVVVGGVSFEEGAFRTLQSLVVMFSDTSTPIERLLEIFLALVGVFLVWWVLWSVADMLLDGNLQKYLNSKIYEIMVGRMKNHIIIVGGGRVGSEIALNLQLKKKKFVIIEQNPEVIKSLKKKKYMVIEGNAEEDKLLTEAEISKATKLILTLPKTESNILITLTAKEMNPNIEILARANEQKFVSKLKKAGAKKVIVPEIVAGDQLTDLLEK